ncbi:hypothetical protein BKA62DRAFT_817991 [Auriculariales sp. MPI-PUGE-AT-0066]|nr:hypothetical protein BKA62DRAFT_817991 [Auriculariales sp. MPI-PUGE-AT-0066]
MATVWWGTGMVTAETGLRNADEEAFAPLDARSSLAGAAGIATVGFCVKANKETGLVAPDGRLGLADIANAVAGLTELLLRCGFGVGAVAESNVGMMGDASSSMSPAISARNFNSGDVGRRNACVLEGAGSGDISPHMDVGGVRDVMERSICVDAVAGGPRAMGLVVALLHVDLAGTGVGAEANGLTARAGICVGGAGTAPGEIARGDSSGIGLGADLPHDGPQPCLAGACADAGDIFGDDDRSNNPTIGLMHMMSADSL